MPNRVLREGILTSERVAALKGWAEEVFYRRLMSVVDDYGRYVAHPKLLRAALYPLCLDRVSDADIEKWMLATAEAALVSVYTARDGKRYLELADFRQHARAEKSRYPGPDEAIAAQPQGGGVAPAVQMQCRCSADAVHPHSEAEAKAKAEAEACVSRGRAREGPTAESAHTPPSEDFEEARPEWGPERYVAQLRGLRPEYARLREAQILNALKVEPDPELRSEAWREAMAALAGKLETDQDPLRLVRAYLRNARRRGRGAGEVLGGGYDPARETAEVV